MDNKKLNHDPPVDTIDRNRTRRMLAMMAGIASATSAVAAVSTTCGYTASTSGATQKMGMRRRRSTLYMTIGQML